MIDVGPKLFDDVEQSIQADSMTVSMLVSHSGLSIAMDFKGTVMRARLPTTLSPAV
jgi:hypothetical protein